MAFEYHLEENLLELLEELESDLYQPGTYASFMICDPKQRHIHKASVRDRLVHQWLVSAVEPLFDKRFIHDSFSCRKDKGTHAAVTRLDKFLRSASRNNSRKVYVLKGDIHRFFASVDHGILRKLILRHVNDSQILRVLDQVIDSFSMQPGKGIPLGNVTSQLFANVYLHELDWFVKHQLRESHYVRYCDDFVIVSTSRARLLDILPKISEFLEKQLRLNLHPQKLSLRPYHQGVDFLGYIIKPTCILVRTKTKNRMLQRVTETNLSSYIGLCAHANTHELEKLIRNIAGVNKVVQAP